MKTWIVLVGILWPLNWCQAQNVIERGKPKSSAITLEKMSYRDLGETIKAQRGKIVLVDFWGEFCPPCKKAFPQFMGIHRKYQNKGVVALSVSLDDPTDIETEDKVNRFLKSKDATCRNILLLEKAKVWQEKLQTPGPPCVYLFDQKGQLINRWCGDQEIDYTKIEKRIQQLLTLEKP